MFRMLKISWISLKYGLDEVVLDLPVCQRWKFLRYLNPWNWWRDPRVSRGERVRLCLEKLGPLFVKLGQVLTTRQDLLPDDIIEELNKLQDRVTPFPGAQAQKIVEKAYGCEISQVFTHFELSPMGSASIAQVHAATLPTGEEVVVKVLRPKIHAMVASDVKLMRSIARRIERWLPAAKRFRPTEVVDEFDRNLLEELDLVREAANASQLRRNFGASHKKLYIPEIYWDYTRSNILVLERIFGIPVTNLEALKARQINLKKLAETGVEIFFTQVFRDCFFHADMHSGNIFVDASDPEQPRYLAVDFGIMGSLGPEDQYYLAHNMLAFFKRDYRRIAVLHIESGWVRANTRVDVLEAAIRSVCEPVFEKRLQDISFGKLLLRLFQVAKNFDMEIQPQLLLLQKTMLSVEGLGRQLYPDLDLWHTAHPFLEKWVKEKIGVRGLLQNVRENLPLWNELLPELPELFYRNLKQQLALSEAANKQLVIKTKMQHFEPQEKPWQRKIMRLGGGALMVSGILLGVNSEIFYSLFQHGYITAAVLVVLGFLLLK